MNLLLKNQESLSVTKWCFFKVAGIMKIIYFEAQTLYISDTNVSCKFSKIS